MLDIQPCISGAARYRVNLQLSQVTLVFLHRLAEGDQLILRASDFTKCVVVDADDHAFMTTKTNLEY